MIEGNVNPVMDTLKGKLTSIFVPEIDTTLSKEGYSADAKAVGDALNEVNTTLEGMSGVEEMTEELNQVKQDIANQVLIFENASVAVDSWTEDTTYEDYPYKADVACEGVTPDYKPDVTFDVPEATSGTYAPVATTGSAPALIVVCLSRAVKTVEETIMFLFAPLESVIRAESPATIQGIPT